MLLGRSWPLVFVDFLHVVLVVIWEGVGVGLSEATPWVGTVPLHVVAADSHCTARRMLADLQ